MHSLHINRSVLILGLTLSVLGCERMENLNFGGDKDHKKKAPPAQIPPDQAPGEDNASAESQIKEAQSGTTAIGEAMREDETLLDPVTQEPKKSVTSPYSTNPQDILGTWRSCVANSTIYIGDTYTFNAGGVGSVTHSYYTDSACQVPFSSLDGVDLGAETYDIAYVIGRAIQPYGFALDRFISQFPSPDVALYGAFLIEGKNLYFEGLYDRAPILESSSGGSDGTRDITIDKSKIYLKQ